jgi:hypothetical protein
MRITTKQRVVGFKAVRLHRALAVSAPASPRDPHHEPPRAAVPRGARRTKIIPHAFGERPVLKRMYATVIRAADRWSRIQVGEFERRQLRVIRDELNRAHAQRIAPAVQKLRKRASACREGSSQ